MAYSRQNFADGQTLTAENLNHIEAGIVQNETEITKKQGLLKSGENIKTINGESILGAGDLLFTQSQWNGKTAVFVGDSITASKSDYVYYKLVSNTLGLDSVGMGLNGSCVSKKSKKGDNPTAIPLSSRYTSIPEKDLIVIFMGTNDWNHETPLGTIDDATDISFYGAWNVVIPYLQKTYTASRIVLITPLHRYGYGSSYATGEERTYDHIPNDSGHTLKDYVDAIKAVGERYSVPVIDLFSLSGLNPALSEIRKKYMTDGLHPNADGSKIIANIIARFLNLYATSDMISTSTDSGGDDSGEEGTEETIVTDVTLSKKATSIFVGSSANITATIVPDTAENKNVMWTITSGSEYIDISASDLTCTIIAKAVGTASVQVTTEDGGYIAICTITVEEDTSIDLTEIEMEYGNAFLSNPNTDKNRISSSVNVYAEGSKTFALKDVTNYSYALYECTGETERAGGKGSGYITTKRSFSNKWVGVLIKKVDNSDFDFSKDSNKLSDYITIS